MKTKFKPPLAVHFIWHPSDAAVVDPILIEVRKSFARDKDRPFSRGLNIPLFFYSSQNADEVPDCYPSEEAARNVVFVFTSVNTAGSPKWTGYIENIIGGSLNIVPIAVDKYGLYHEGGLKSLNCVRSYEWPNEDNGLYAIVALAHEIYRHGLVEINLEEQGKNSSVTIFLSYAKSGDTGRLHAESVKRFIDNTNMHHFFDATEISPGFLFNEEIEKNILRSTLLLIGSDAYSSRYWCQREILCAKQHCRPIVAVDCLEDYEDRIFPACSNVPCVHVSPDTPLSNRNILRILVAAILETIRHGHALKSLEFYRNQGWIDQDTEISSRPIEIRQALSVKDKGKSKVCYPEPPVYLEEADWHEKVDVMAFTPLWKPCDHDKFKNMRIGISISDVPSNGHVFYHLHADHLTRLAQDIARHLLSRSAIVIYGGDLRMDGFTQFILEEAIILKNRLMTDSVQVENHLAWPLYLDSNDGNYVKINTWRAMYKDVIETKEHIIPADILHIVDSKTFLSPINTLNKYIWSRCLTEMRQHSISSSSARICAGGKLDGYKGKMPGVLEEILIALEHSKPIYLLGAFSGVVGEVCHSIRTRTISKFITEDWQIKHNPGYSDLQEWARAKGYHADYEQIKIILMGLQVSDIAKNTGLSEAEYLRLMISPFVDECVHLILKGLGNISDMKDHNHTRIKGDV